MMFVQFTLASSIMEPHTRIAVFMDPVSGSVLAWGVFIGWRAALRGSTFWCDGVLSLRLADLGFRVWGRVLFYPLSHDMPEAMIPPRDSKRDP